jgi:hypothetical protein
MINFSRESAGTDNCCVILAKVNELGRITILATPVNLG